MNAMRSTAFGKKVIRKKTGLLKRCQFLKSCFRLSVEINQRASTVFKDEFRNAGICRFIEINKISDI